MSEPVFSLQEFRNALGHFCTGVAIATTVYDGSPVGFSLQSFVSLSLEPPLVLICPSRDSQTWPVIEETGNFTVNVLASHHQELSSAFSKRLPNRFAGFTWTTSPAGNPIFDDVLAAVDVSVENVFDGGDHHIVVGRVHWLSTTKMHKPLLFHKGRYTTIED